MCFGLLFQVSSIQHHWGQVCLNNRLASGMPSWPVVFGEECPGGLEREFDVLDKDLGSGELGCVLKLLSRPLTCNLQFSKFIFYNEVDVTNIKGTDQVLVETVCTILHQCY